MQAKSKSSKTRLVLNDEKKLELAVETVAPSPTDPVPPFFAGLNRQPGPFPLVPPSDGAGVPSGSGRHQLALNSSKDGRQPVRPACPPQRSARLARRSAVVLCQFNSWASCCEN